MKIRCFLIRHTLPKSQVDLLLAWKRGETDRPERITYRKRRMIRTVEAPSVQDAVKRFEDDREALPEPLEGWRQWIEVAGACLEEYGEKRVWLEGCFSAEDVDLIPKEVA